MSVSGQHSLKPPASPPFLSTQTFVAGERKIENDTYSPSESKSGLNQSAKSDNQVIQLGNVSYLHLQGYHENILLIVTAGTKVAEVP